jgi:hypothetical protein
MPHEPQVEAGILSPRDLPVRRLYVAPVLRVYGDAAELTKTVSNGSMIADGGSMAFSKTS